MSPRPTPMMRQYLAAKERHPGTILFFRMGDFYEMFFEDAELASSLLDITLTSRGKQGGENIPMCGVPHHAADAYMTRLTDRGYRVAICDQLEDPARAKGLVERDVRRTVTPGLIFTEESLNSKAARFLAAAAAGPGPEGPEYALAALEASTGNFRLGFFSEPAALRHELYSLEPREILLAEGAPAELREIVQPLNVCQTILPDEHFQPERSRATMERIWPRPYPADSPLAGRPLLEGLAGGILEYAEKACGAPLLHLSKPALFNEQAYLGLDDLALKNLEILKPLNGDDQRACLLGFLDRTRTPMGARLLRQWLVKPLKGLEPIGRRHEAVSCWLLDSLGRERLTKLIARAGDLERAVGRLVLGRGGPRDLAAIHVALGLLPELKELLLASPSTLLSELGRELPLLKDIYALLGRALILPPPLNLREGGVIKKGYSPELDGYLALERGGKDRLAALEAKERAATGINSLKVAYNRVFGYYLEVTKSHLGAVPASWIRKQTIAGGERYITPELKEWEEKILTAGEKRLALEEKILEDLKNQVAAQAAGLKKAASIMAQADLLSALAEVAEKHNFTRPELVAEPVIDIQGGRHPVVEHFLPDGEPFVANDVRLSPEERLLIITGPNMAGKSTILRQTALIVILNQLGSFVPAQKAVLSARDHIFTRVGAGDDLTRGRSTFMVEMTETARILHRATPNSLVVLDEVGRGTSTFDGLSIAWAVAEHLHDRGAFTLFATHYHELVDLARVRPHVRNFNVAVKSWKNKIIFLRKLSPGGASRSHGLAVAKLAGLPGRVLDRAGQVLAVLEEAGGAAKLNGSAGAQRQLSLFQAPPEPPPAADHPENHPLLTALSGVDINQLSPLKALETLHEFIEKARRGLEADDQQA